MTGRAPTLADIFLAKHQLTIFCEGCRVTRPIDVEKAALARDEHKPIDRFRFRCSKCGMIGKPQVHGLGNAAMGFPLVWPKL